ncbi:hypothetical protein [Bacillus sp. 22483]|uniref:hypothetical protein n=1 Tax=Bacillus sp. 22483 TaxID=3453927 RepID=UPI003F87A7F7
MGELALKRIIYKGDKYHYSSRELKRGLQIVEAENGAGKTTFSSLVSYGLGMYVKQFDFKNNKENHIEIYNDTNNYVLLIITLNGVDYEVTRYFNPSNNNIIFVKGNGTESSFVLNRKAISKKDDLTFSDWILEQLGIKVCEIYQGTRKFKISFSDLFRLIHYDQDTSDQKIYKEHRNESNFISDSIAVRKVIFELLVGYQFSDYYALIGEYNHTERETNTLKTTLENYEEMAARMKYRVREINLEDAINEVAQLKTQIEKLDLFRRNLKQSEYNLVQFDSFIEKLRIKKFNRDNSITELESSIKATTIELNNLQKLRSDLVLEVTQIKKIILAHEELNIFSPNTCPSCLRNVQRRENHCICGHPIDESEYEKFFYSADEYLAILKSKQKSVETIEAAIKSCEEELKYSKEKLINLEIDRDKLKDKLLEVKDDIKNTSNDIELNTVNDRLLEVKNNLQISEQRLNIIKQYYEIKKEYTKGRGKLEKLDLKLKKMEKIASELIGKQKTEFEAIYSNLMKKADNQVNRVELDENYMPIINGGTYRQASSYVPRRFLYYLTLIKLSLESINVPFPKFLLIDTPENLGIDEENLIKCMSLIDEVANVNEGKSSTFQIILTTGRNKYPEKYNNFVIERLTEENKLLKNIR